MNLSRLRAGGQGLVPDRRGTWFVTTLASTGLVAGIGAAALISSQPAKQAGAMVPAHVDLRPVMPALRQTVAASLSPLADPGIPSTTASISLERTVTVTDDVPVLRHLDETPLLEGRNPAVERAAEMAARAAVAGLAAPQLSVDKPTVVSAGTAPLRLASLAPPTNFTALAKREPAESGPEANTNTIVVAEGDTLYDILDTYGVTTSEAVGVARALAEVFPPHGLRAGQELTLTTSDEDGGRSAVLSLILLTDEGEFEVAREGDGSFAARAKSVADGNRAYRRALAGIEGSLYGTARVEGVPDSVIVRMMRTHSYDVDFQREIHAGDLFEVFYATGGEEDGAGRSRLLYSSLSTNGKTRSYYRFTAADGTTDYYDAEGVSSKKPLMKTPINGARISSGFGMRKHPILGYTKMHGGTDFAAPSGTPILAAGDGEVVVAGRNGGYGNYIKLKHKSDLETAYAHLSRLAKGIKPGKQVRQGDVIGYVGTTGRSTGPHLHYEIHIGGKKQNPLTVKVAGGGRKLEGAELAAFEAERRRIDELRADTAVEALVAAAQP